MLNTEFWGGKNKFHSRHSQSFIWILLLASIWSLAFITSIIFNIQNKRTDVMTQALSKANAALDKDTIYRHLVSSIGGVYVPVNRGIKPNPFLAHVKHRDITTIDGQKLTLVNSSYFTRLVHDYEETKDPNGIYGKTSSLNPLRPENAANDWQKQALTELQKGELQWTGVSIENGQKYFHLMKPRKVKTSCLSCHFEQSYRIGDILGGLSISIPLKPIFNHTETLLIPIKIWHFIFWLFGMLGLISGSEIC